MKNYLFKGFITLFTAIAMVSCTKEPLDVDADRLPFEETDDIKINLTLANTEQDMTPQTKAIPDGGDSKFDESLTAIVFAEVPSQAGTYKYYSVRPVVKVSDGNFRLSLPGTLIGRKIRLHVYSNSMDILTSNIYTRFTRNTTTEAEVISALTLTTTGRWDVGTNYKRIPMYGKADFALQASTTSIGTISLRRMMARVDVGLNYNNATETATPTSLNNFEIIHMLVYNTKNKGQLIAGGSDPSVPKDGETILAYQSDPLNNVKNAIIRDVFLFEHTNAGADFKQERPCIILYGRYCPNPTATTKTWVPGYYRIDFYKDGKYLDIIRNTLYRFDITSVSGVGHLEPGDALKNVASNVVINLQSYTMGHNETEFNGQDYLSVNKSTITIYRNLLTANFTVKTSHPFGWEINKVNAPLIVNYFAPKTGPQNTETLVTLTFSGSVTYPKAGIYEFFIKAGNLEKKMYVNVIEGNAPDDLTNFSIPPVLYFARSGGNSIFPVSTNINRAYFNFTAGDILHNAIPNQVTGDKTVINLPLNIRPTTIAHTGPNSSIEGSLQVNVIAGNADLSASSKIVQFTDPKQLTVHMAQIPAGGASSHRMYYVLPGAPTTGISTGNHKYYVVNAENLVDGANTITAPNGADGYFFTIPENTQYAPREYFRFTVYPTVIEGATLNDKINIIGHTPPVVVVKQDAAPEPTFTVGPLAINYDNLSLDVVVSQGLNVKGGFQVQSKKGIFGNGDAQSQNITDNADGRIALTTTFNRGNTRTDKIKVNAIGFNNSVREPGKEITVTQSGANHGNYNNLGLPSDATVGPNVTTHTFKFTGMKNANMFEAKMERFTNGSPGISFNVPPPIENMKYTLGDSEATYTVTFNKNDDINDKTAKFVFYVYPINQNTNPGSNYYTRILTQLKTDKSITFDLTQEGGAPNPILKPYRLSNNYYIRKVIISNVTGAKLEIRKGSVDGELLSTAAISNEVEASIVIPANDNAERILYLIAIDDNNKIYHSEKLVQQPAINKQWGIREKTSSYGGQCTQNNTSTVNGKVYTTNDSRLPLFYNDIYLADNFQHPQSSIQFWYYFLETTTSYKLPFAYFDGSKDPVLSEGKNKQDLQYYRCIFGTLGNAKN